MELFSFQYRVKPADLWILSMINIYRSMMGVVNIVFTASMVLLAVRFWTEASPTLRILMGAGIGLFPLFQPLMIFVRSGRIVRSMPEDMRMDFDPMGMTVTAGDKSSRVDYWDLKSVMRISGLLIIYTRARQGFILNREALEDKGKELYDFLSTQLK